MMMTDEEKKQFQNLINRVRDLEGQVATMKVGLDKALDPLPPIFIAKMASATTWTERTTVNGTSANDYTAGRSSMAAPCTLEDGAAVLMEIPGPSTYNYLRLAGGTTASPTVLSGGSAGPTTADATTWGRSGGTTSIDMWVTDRVVWDSSGDVLYAYQRKLSFDSGGNLFKVSGETRYTVDTPTAC